MTFDNENGAGGSVNTAIIEGSEVVGTSTFDILCEEQGLSTEECAEIKESHEGQQKGVGASIGFSGTGGGNTGANGDDLIVKREDGDLGVTSGFILPVRSSGYVVSGPVRKPITAHVVEEVTADKQKVRIARTTFKRVAKSYAPVANINHADRVEPSSVDKTYGQYMTKGDLAEWRIKQRFGDTLAHGTSYQIFGTNG